VKRRALGRRPAPQVAVFKSGEFRIPGHYSTPLYSFSIKLQTMATAIVTTMARLDDEVEMTKFLSPIPSGDQLAKVLERRKPVSTRAYEDETRTARFVESDGNVVMCFTVADITIDQAEMIEAAWEGICALDETVFQNAVEQVLLDPFHHAKSRKD
jgi:hypothetical protein